MAKSFSLEAFKFSVYLSIPIAMTVFFAMNPSNLEEIIRNRMYVVYPASAPDPPSEKETKKEFKRKKTSSKSDDSDVNDDDAEDEKRRRKKSKSEEEKEVSLDSLLRRVDPAVMLDKNDDENDKMLKRIRAKLKCALEANVLHFSKRASGITKNASVTAERAHAWRQAVRGYGDEENDERGPGNVDSVLNVFKAMSDVLMAIVSVDSKCSDDDSDDESEIVKKYSPFASQLRALSTKAF